MDTRIFNQDFFQKLNTLKLSLNMRLSQGMSGVRKSSAKGSSVEFSDFREYMLGDDIRRIDWNAYGRTDKLYIKQFMEEKEGIFHLFLDGSRSMEFGEHPKSVMALQIVAALSYMILGNLDRVYVYECEADQIIKGKGMTGMAAFPHVLEQLQRVNFDGETRLNEAISKCPLQKGGVSFVISDFLDEAGMEAAMKYLAYHKQTIVLVQVLAREELLADYEGTCNLLDMETGEHVKITMSNDTISKYRERLEQLQRELNRLARKYGATFITVMSDVPLVQIMLQNFSGILQGK